MGKTKIKTIDDSEKTEEPKKAKPASVKDRFTFGRKKLGRADEPVPQTTQPRAQAFGSEAQVFDSEVAQTRGARRGKRDELVEKLKAELGVKTPANTSEVGFDSSEVRKGQEPTQPQTKEQILKRVQVFDSEGGARSAQTRRDDKKKKTAKAKPRSKKYQEVSEDLDKTKAYPIEEAVDIVKKLSYSKFNATLEAHINTAQTGIHGLVSLPYASGKKLRILAFGKGAPSSGDILVGDDPAIDEISKGKVDFDLVITTPEWMPKLAKVAKVLGPKGLMPNPKNGTIAEDLKKAVESFQQGKTEYKTESKAAVIHLALGKLDQPSEELSQNVKILLSTLGKSRIKKVTLSPTMGPAVKVDLRSI